MPLTRLDVSTTPGAYVILSSLVWLNIADFGFKAGFWVLWPIVRSLHAEMIIGTIDKVSDLSLLAYRLIVFVAFGKVLAARNTFVG